MKASKAIRFFLILSIATTPAPVGADDWDFLRGMVPRPHLEPGRMAVYSVLYDGVPEEKPGSDRPVRFYVPTFEFRQPGLWTRSYAFHHFERKRIRIGDRMGSEQDFLGGENWQVFGVRYDLHGVCEYIRPALYGFPGRHEHIYDSPPLSGIHINLKQSALLNEETPARDLLPSGDRLWLRDAPGDDRFLARFDTERRLFESFRWAAIATGGSIYKGPVLESLEFRLEGVREFPPSNLGERIQTARTRAASFLLEHKGAMSEIPWARQYPAGVRALVAWALLEAGHAEASRTLLVEALARPLRTTYDLAFLTLALSAQIEVEERAAVPQSGTFVLSATRSKLRKPLAQIIARLHRQATTETGLWGYERSLDDPPADPDADLRTYHAGPRFWKWKPGREIADSSNTFFALLALQRAGDLGIPTAPRVFRKAADSLESWGTYLFSEAKERYRAEYFEKPEFYLNTHSEEARRLWKERFDMDVTLRLERSLRGGFEEPNEGSTTALAARPFLAKRGSVRIFHYAYDGSAQDPRQKDNWPFGPDLICRTNVYPTQIAGVGSLALAYAGAGVDPLARPTVQEGLLWAQSFFRYILSAPDIPKKAGLPAASPGDLGYNFFIFGSLSDFLGIRTLGHHDWWPLLALTALDYQREDGGFYPWREDRVVPTALFLLFLSRPIPSSLVTELPRYERPPIATGVEGARDERTLLLVETDDGSSVSGLEVLSSLTRIDTRERVELAKRALAQADDALSRRYVPLLIRIYQQGDSRARRFARDALAKITGTRSTKVTDWLEWLERGPTEG